MSHQNYQICSILVMTPL